MRFVESAGEIEREVLPLTISSSPFRFTGRECRKVIQQLTQHLYEVDAALARAVEDQHEFDSDETHAYDQDNGDDDGHRYKEQGENGRNVSQQPNQAARPTKWAAFVPDAADVSRRPTQRKECPPDDDERSYRSRGFLFEFLLTHLRATMTGG